MLVVMGGGGGIAILVDNTGGGRYHRHCPYSLVGLLLLSLMVVASMTLVVVMRGM